MSERPLERQLRQMIAALEDERQALATLDLDLLTSAVRDKEALCDVLEPVRPDQLNGETRALASTARQLNDVNRRVRNLLAANVATRLEALGVPQPAYRADRLATAG
jgi:hypothetical protein